MTFLPIVGRELRVASRRRSTYWSRFFTGISAIIIVFFVYVEGRNQAPYILADTMFKVLSFVSFIYCLGVGVRATADCLSEEKREGTLGLLFLTDLKGYDVVLGKLVATSMNAFYRLLAILPLLAIPLLMGGVTNGEFWRMALVLANTFLFSLAIGMFMSSISTSPRKAMAGTVIVVLLFTLGLPFATSAIKFIYNSPQLMLVANTLTPGSSFEYSDDAHYASNPQLFWSTTIALHGIAWVLLVLASLIVPRSWQDRPAGAKIQSWRERWRRWSFGNSAERRSFRNGLLDINAFFWLAARARLKPMQVWMAFIIIACFWSWGAAANGNEWMNAFVYLMTAIVVNTVLKIWITSEAGRRLGEDRKLGALELLLSTELSVKEILHGQLLALKRQFFWPVMVALVIETVFLLAAVKSSHADAEEIAFCGSYGVVIMIMLVADVITLSVLGMWMSLTARNPNRATGMALRRIFILPWAIIFFVFFIGAQMAYSGLNGSSVWKFFLALYAVTGILADLWFGLDAWRRLQNEFREIATQRFTATPSFWSRFFRTRSSNGI